MAETGASIAQGGELAVQVSAGAALAAAVAAVVVGAVAAARASDAKLELIPPGLDPIIQGGAGGLPGQARQ